MISMALACYPKPVISDEPMEDVILKPIHPYTKSWISNVAIPDPTVKGKSILIREETPTPLDLPEGCRFCPRCGNLERCADAKSQNYDKSVRIAGSLAITHSP